MAIRGDLESPRVMFYHKKKEIHGKAEEVGCATVAALTGSLAKYKFILLPIGEIINWGMSGMFPEDIFLIICRNGFSVILSAISERAKQNAKENDTYVVYKY